MQVLQVTAQAVQQLQSQQLQAQPEPAALKAEEKNPHYVGLVEKVLRVGEGFFYAVAKLAGGIAVVATATVEILGEQGDKEACPLNGKAGTFTSITLLSGSISAVALGISGFCTSAADSSAVKRLNILEQKRLKHDDIKSLRRTLQFRKPPFVLDKIELSPELSQQDMKSNKIAPDAIEVESPAEQAPISSICQFTLASPALCERVLHVTERVFAAIAKMTGGLSVLGFSVMQLQQKRLQVCSMGYLIEPINMTSTVLGSIAAIALGLSTTIATAGEYIKTNRVNRAIDPEVEPKSAVSNSPVQMP